MIIILPLPSNFSGEWLVAYTYISEVTQKMVPGGGRDLSRPYASRQGGGRYALPNTFSTLSGVAGGSTHLSMAL